VSNQETSSYGKVTMESVLFYTQ